jgi:pimeloyl-ACP methyl ester carboxylesterase
LEQIEQRLSKQPKISVPTIALDGNVNGVLPPEGSKHHQPFFTGKYERRVLEEVGHNLPQEAPRDFAEAVLSLL